MLESSHVSLVVESATLAEKVGAEFADPVPVEVKWPVGCNRKLMLADWSPLAGRKIVKLGADDAAQQPDREAA